MVHTYTRTHIYTRSDRHRKPIENHDGRATDIQQVFNSSVIKENLSIIEIEKGERKISRCGSTIEKRCFFLVVVFDRFSVSTFFV